LYSESEDLESLSKWLRFNKLKINVTKTKYMIIRGRRLEAGAHNDLCIDDESIEEVASMKYLVQIDDRLTFKEHLDLSKKLAKKIGFLVRTPKKLTCRTKTMIYKIIIKPYIDYCSSIIFMRTICTTYNYYKTERYGLS
jgi:hypothetical protein